MKRFKVLIACFLVSITIALQGQKRDGLPELYPAYSEDFSDYSSFPSTCFEHCVQDKNGRLWLIPCLAVSAHASLHLFQFDGYEFRNMQGDIEKLPVNVHFVGIDRQRTTLIWYATEAAGNALFFYDLQNHRLQKEDIHLQGYISAAVVSRDNRVLLAIKQAGQFVIAEWNDGQLMELGSLEHSEDLSNYNNSVFYFNDRETWFFIQNPRNQIVRFNFGNNTAKKYFFSDFKPKGVSPEASTIIIPAMPLNLSGDVYFFTLNTIEKEPAVTLYKFQEEKDVIERVAWQPDVISERSRVFQDNSGNDLFLFADQNRNYEAILQDSMGNRYDYSAFVSDLKGEIVYSIRGTDFRREAIICTDGGIYAKQGINRDGIRHFLDGVSIRAMIELPDQKVMISVQQVGNYVLDLKTNTVETNIKVPGCPFDRQFARPAFYYDQEGKLLTTDGGTIIKYDTSTQICESFFTGLGNIRNFTPIDIDQVVVFTAAGKLFLYRFSTDQVTPVLKNGTPIQVSGYPNGMLQDQKGRLWIASNSGLWKIKLENGDFEVLGKEAPFLDSRFLAMTLDEWGRLWLGTPLGGVHIYDPDTKSVAIINNANGLANNTVVDILEDTDGDWWLGTYNGISVVNRQGELITNLGLKDGLVEKECNRFASLRTKDGKVLIGTINGLNVIDPKIIKDRIQQHKDLKIYLTSLEYFNTSKGEKANESLQLNDLKTLELPPAKRFLNLSFALSKYHSSRENQFAYMLEGVDSDWTSLGNQRILSLSNLPPGKYRLLIKGRDASGQWTQEPLALSIHAGEFFYKSLWFYLLLFALTGLIALVWIWRLRIEIEEATQQIRSDKAIIEIQAKRLKEKDLAKSLFFTNISHEFRTPLTVISGMANQIEGQDKIKDLIRRNSLSLLNMVNQILDLRKLESGKLQLDLVQADMVQYVQYVLASYDAIAALKSVKLHFLPKEKEIFMDFDQEKFMRILSNLLSNAIKFTPEDGNVYLILEKGTITEESGQPAEALKLTVSDTGIGIPKEQQAQVFDRFFQVKNDAAANRRKSRSESDAVEMPGTGIGLSLAKDLITLMGGRISLESAPGKGSSFTVVLPISREAMKVKIEQQTVEEFSTLEFDQAAIENEIGSILTETTPVEKGNELSLLIIEDNRDVQQYLLSLLESKYNLYLAGNGREGIEMAFEHMPDLIISDVMMPEKDGFEVCDTLKNDDRTSHIPIILLTARAGVESRIQGLERGADAYLAKPFNEKELFIRLEKLVELRRLLQKRYQYIQPPAEAFPAPEIVTGFEKEDAFMAKLQQVVVDNLDNTDFGPTQLCEAMGMSRSHLHLKIKALTNLSTSVFIRTIRLHKARELLQKSELNVTQVAFEVGFNDLSYFSRKFKEEFGVNPQKFTQS